MLAKRIEGLVRQALADFGLEDAPGLKIDIPPDNKFGDYATNAAITNAKNLKKNPLTIAHTLAAKIKELDSERLIREIQVAPPGFINIFLDDHFLQREILAIKGLDRQWGRAVVGRGEKILLEFVSANPTGPLHVGHGRWAVLGDVIARLLTAAGYEVATEFYVNNVGNQVEKLWASVEAVRVGGEVPEGGYGGAYVKEVQGNSREEVVAFLLKQQQEILNKLGVNFDNYFLESSLHEKGEVKEAIGRLAERGLTFEENGALWFKAQELGDDKNRVLVKEDGHSTYFAADLAYHLDKYKRGYGHLINIWGTDHHGYVPRLKLAVAAMGFLPENLEIIIGQLVSLYRGDEQVRMSKRTGEMVTLEEVVEEIGCDATRFFFAATDANTHLDFDLELAKKKTNDNPVFYVQYAHARICSIINKAGGVSAMEELEGLADPAERELILKILSFPDVVAQAARSRSPNRLTEYGKELATVFHHFYEKCRVLGHPSRLLLADASRITLRNVLELLGISAPEAM